VMKIAGSIATLDELLAVLSWQTLSNLLTLLTHSTSVACFVSFSSLFHRLGYALGGLKHFRGRFFCNINHVTL
jgi:hypothetical protein